MGDVKRNEIRLSSIIKTLPNCQVLHADKDILFTHISSNSKEIKKGSLFICIRGQKTDGHNFIEEAIKKKARGILIERSYLYNNKLKYKIPIILVDNSRKAMAKIAALIYDYPASKIKTIGITGTNGKTTTASFITSILQKAGYKTTKLSTIIYQLDNLKQEAILTTPDAILLQKLLYKSVELGNDFVVMEVSSHALSLDRVEECLFDVGIYTNLGFDHLDFHKTLPAYLEAKSILFSRLLKSNGCAILNKDDDYTNMITNQINNNKIIYYGIYKKDKHTYTLLPRDLRLSSKTEFFVGDYKITLKLPGLYNVYNALAAITCAEFFNIKKEYITEGLLKTQVPGRFNILGENNPVKVIIDYAHTPEAMEIVIKTSRAILKPKRIITIFGCGGNRNKEKRALMGAVATCLSDFTIITSDNPRDELPPSIIQDILRGINSKTLYKVIEERKEAIEYGITETKVGDLVLIFGKGHEKYQIIKDKKLPFDDTKVARNVLNSIYNKDKKN